MTGYAREFDEIATMSLRLTINSFLKIIIKYGKNWNVNEGRFWK